MNLVKRDTETPRLAVVPLDLNQANIIVDRWHRHHGKIQGHRFSVGALDPLTLLLHGAVIVGRPVSRHYNPATTIEVSRLVTDGTPHVASMLYAAAARAAKELGYSEIHTYILDNETGTSLVAAGWQNLGASIGGSWDRYNRPRDDRHPASGKRRWGKSLRPFLYQAPKMLTDQDFEELYTFPEGTYIDQATVELRDIV